MEKIKLRKATTNDRDDTYQLFEQIQNLHAKNHPELFKQAKYDNKFKEFYENLMNSKTDRLVLVTQDKLPIAYIHYFLGYKFETMFNNSYPFGFIYQVIVDSKHRKKGVAKKLLEYAKNDAKEFGAIILSIDHFSFNGAARQCFMSAGFVMNREFMSLDI